MIRNSFYFTLDTSELTSFFAQIAPNAVFIFGSVIPEPSVVSDSARWRLQNWGTTSERIGVTINRNMMVFDTEDIIPDMFLSRLIAKFSCPSFEVMSASDELGTVVRHLCVDKSTITPLPVQGNPVEFACWVWGLDFLDYCVKTRNRKRGIILHASDVDKLTSIKSDEDDAEYNDIDCILAYDA